MFYNLGIAYVWKYDQDFVRLIVDEARKYDVSVYQITSENVEQTIEQLRERRMRFDVVLDRASDEDEQFLPIAHRGRDRKEEPEDAPRLINPSHLHSRASDKAAMHVELLSHGINVPYSYILPSYNDERNLPLSSSDLEKLGHPFVIKPASTTGGGQGVVKDASTMEDVLIHRQQFPFDKYLVQETIRPAYFSENRGWFRVFYAFGMVIPCWWDDELCLYEEVSDEELDIFGLSILEEIVLKLQKISQLDFFSTEIAFSCSQKFVVVDYFNEMCDMRLQSRYRDGVPDRVVQKVAKGLIEFVLAAAKS